MRPPRAAHCVRLGAGGGQTVLRRVLTGEAPLPSARSALPLAFPTLRTPRSAGRSAGVSERSAGDRQLEAYGFGPRGAWRGVRFPSPVLHPGGEGGMFEPGASGELGPAQAAAFKLAEQRLAALGRHALPAGTLAGRAIFLRIGKRHSPKGSDLYAPRASRRFAGRLRLNAAFL